MINLTTDKNLDKHLRLVKSGEENTSLELATAGNGAKIHGNLSVDGTIDSKSVYPGQILGYTALGADANAASYNVTNSYAVISDDHKVTFVAPPSGKVEIEASCFVVVTGMSARPLYLSLSSQSATDGYLTVDVQHEQVVAAADETDSTGIICKWVIEGLTSGTSYTYWIGTKSTHALNLRLYWGGDTTGEYAPFIVKATALPVSINDGN